ncbi:hypothetical protein Pelo_372 [Pelomyxa schiedti]|nr:hypothetical protein Pelo_372 [Pelomyxa schiedti]
MSLVGYGSSDDEGGNSGAESDAPDATTTSHNSDSPAASAPAVATTTTTNKPTTTSGTRTPSAPDTSPSPTTTTTTATTQGKTQDTPSPPANVNTSVTKGEDDVVQLPMKRDKDDSEQPNHHQQQQSVSAAAALMAAKKRKVNLPPPLLGFESKALPSFLKAKNEAPVEIKPMEAPPPEEVEVKPDPITPQLAERLSLEKDLAAERKLFDIYEQREKASRETSQQREKRKVKKFGQSSWRTDAPHGYWKSSEEMHLRQHYD